MPFSRAAARLQRSPLARRLAAGAFWSLAGAAAARGAALLAAVLVARHLGRARYGEFAAIQSSVNMFSVFAGFGLGLTSTRYVAELRRTDPARAGRILALSSVASLATGLAAALGVIAAAPWLAAHALNAPSLAVSLRLSAPIVLFGAWAGSQAGGLAGFEDFRGLARANAAAGLIGLPLVVGGVLAGGVPGGVCGLAAASAAACALNGRALRAQMSSAGIRAAYDGLSAEWSVLWRFSVPAALGGLMIGPVTWLCNAMLLHQEGGYGELGMLHAAYQWRIAMVFVPAAVENMLLPVLASLKAADDRSGYRRTLAANLALNGALSLAAAIVVCSGARLIMSAYGPGFERGAPVLALIALSVVLSAPCTVLAQAIAGSGSMWFGLALNVLWGAAFVAATRALVGHGAYGVALAMCLAYAAQLAAASAYAWTSLLGREEGRCSPA